MSQRFAAPPAPNQATHGSWRRRDIQGLRAIAVLAVIAFHAGLPMPGGFTGVDMFFVISGYVITELILRQEARDSFSFRTFYARRAQRLLPALMVMILVVFIASVLWQSPFGEQEATARTGIGAVFLVANIVITRTIGGYFSAEAEANPLLHTWTLSVEEQFYLVFPLLLILTLVAAKRCTTRQRSVSIPLAVVALATAASFGIGLMWSLGSGAWSLTSQPEAWAFYLSPARAWEFGVGALLAILVQRTSLSIGQQTANLMATLGVILLGLSLFAIDSTTPFPGVAALMPVLGSAALLLAGTRTNVTSAALTNVPMVRIGDWSFSLYLWHWPVIVFAVLIWPHPWVPVIAAALSFIPALASYYLLENPIRTATLSRMRVLALSVAGAAMATGAGLALWHLGSSAIPGIKALQVQQAAATWSDKNGCFFGTHFDSEGVDANCWNRVPDARGWILLAGDSHAAAASTGVVTAAANEGYSVFSVTGGACEFSAQAAAFSDMDNCDEMNSFLVQRINSSDPPSAIVIASKGVTAAAPTTVEFLKEKGIPLIWLRDVPRWAPMDQGIQHLPCAGGSINFTCTFPRATVDDYQVDTRAREGQLIAANPSITSIDPWNLFCAEDSCSSIQQGVLRYRDNEHLNGEGSSLLTPLVREAINKALNQRK